MEREGPRSGGRHGFDEAAEHDDVVHALGHDGGAADAAGGALPRRRQAIDDGVEVVIHGGGAAR